MSLKKYFQQKPHRTQLLVVIATLSLVALSISIGSGRARQEAASPKLRYTTSWPLKYHKGKPITTPILYCGDKGKGPGYYATNDSFTPYDATSDDLCESIPIWRWIGSPILLSFGAVFLVALYSVRLGLTNGLRHIVVLIIVLGARYYYWRQTDEPDGADFDSSDHVLLLSVYIWALLWDACHSWLSYPKTINAAFLVFDAFWSVAFLVSLGGTAGIFHTVDETWAGWRDATYFLVAAGLLASFMDTYTIVVERGRYSALSEEDPTHENLENGNTIQF